MKITQLTLKNYKCFEDFEIAFAEEYVDEITKETHPIWLHVLLAPNMVGKSAILKALRVVLATRLQKIKANPGPAAIINLGKTDHRVIGGNPFSNLAEQVSITVQAKATEWDSKAATWQELPFSWSKIKENVSGRNSNRTKTVNHEGDIAQRAYQSYNRSNEQSEGVIPLLLYVGTEYIHQQKPAVDSLKEEGQPKQGYWYCLDDKNMETYVFDWFEMLYRTSLEQALSEQAKAIYSPFPVFALEVFADALKRLLPDILEISWIKNPLEKKEKYFLIFHIEGEGHRTLNMLSDGYRYLVLLLGELVTRAVLLNKHLGPTVLEKATGVVLIDEFGIHLHPSLQSDVLPRLASIFPQIQWIITTHSPLIINGLRKEQVHVIQQNAKQARYVENTEEDVIGFGVEKILVDVFGLPTTYDQQSVAYQQEYAELIAKRTAEGLNAGEEERFGHLSGIMAKFRFDETLFTDDPIKRVVKERLKAKLDSSPSFTSRSLDQDEVGDIGDKVSTILDDILKEMQ
jgi:predicted ATP-binding protein involved in virulence